MASVSFGAIYHVEDGYCARLVSWGATALGSEKASEFRGFGERLEWFPPRAVLFFYDVLIPFATLISSHTNLNLCGPA